MIQRTAVLLFVAGALPLLTGCELGLDREGLYQFYIQRPTRVSGATPALNPSIDLSHAPAHAPGRPDLPVAPRPSPSAAALPLTPPGPSTLTPAVAPRNEAIGDSCAGSRGGDRCVALRYVVYQNDEGDPVETREDTLRNLDGLNRIWSDCGIRFQIDNYLLLRPSVFHLQYRAANYRELNEIREAFASASSFLVVKTGPWNRRGSLGNTGANAWTNLPGEGIYGAILEQSVALDPQMLAHELGHYMSLGHVANRDNVMSPLVYDRSLGLDREQCAEARWSLGFYWSKALR